MLKLRIRIADWRDWKDIQTLRELVPRPFEGGLYELLHWPIYHVHYAMPEETATPIGFTSVVLLDGEDAEDQGTAVVEDWRRKGVASQLRLTQVRDLIEMGRENLFVTAPSNEAANWCATHLDLLARLDDDSLYFGGNCADILNHLLDRGVRVPHQLSHDNKARLLYKAGKATQDVARMQAMVEITLRKGQLRQAYRGGKD